MARSVTHRASAKRTRPTGDAYRNSKLEAEQRFNATCARSDTQYVVLRPPLVYGPSIKGDLAALRSLIDRGIPLPLASIDNQRSLVCIDHFIAAIRKLAVEHPAATGKTFVVSDDRPVIRRTRARDRCSARAPPAPGTRPDVPAPATRPPDGSGPRCQAAHIVIDRRQPCNPRCGGLQGRVRLPGRYCGHGRALSKRKKLESPVAWSPRYRPRGVIANSNSVPSDISLRCLIPLVSAMVAFALLSVLLRYRRLPLDRPNERSLHARPVPRSAASRSFLRSRAGAASARALSGSDLAAGNTVFAVSCIDDVASLSAAFRFAVRRVAATICAVGLMYPAADWVVIAIASSPWPG